MNALAQLCHYYLACLGYDNDAGVSVPLLPQSDECDYLELDLSDPAIDLSDNESVRRMLARVRNERGRYITYIGYPVYISQERRAEPGNFLVEPLTLLPVELNEDTNQPIVSTAFLSLNPKPIQSLSAIERDMVLTEVAQLEAELGFSNGTEQSDLSELAARLHAIRPEWPWWEESTQSQVSDASIPLTEIKKPGIYDRAMVVMVEKPRFTQGLEKELRDLANLSEQDYSNTALGTWLGSKASGHLDESKASTNSILEVLPMNSEQGMAITSALSAPTTIITGPPGTGKSQVVTSLIVNAIWQGKRVLLASKNNKAVDVVEERVNSLGPRPVMLRLGASQSFQTKLAEHLLFLATGTSTPEDLIEFKSSSELHSRLGIEQQRLTTEVDNLINLRNEVDALEQSTERARQDLGEDLFLLAASINRDAVKKAISRVSRAVDGADLTKTSLLTRLLWPLLANIRLTTLRKAISSTRDCLAACGIILPSVDEADSLTSCRTALNLASTRLKSLDEAASYIASLERLQQVRSLEDLTKEEVKLQDRIARLSSDIWKLWLRLQPAQLSAEKRVKLSQYKTLLQMLLEAGGERQLSNQVREKYTAMVKDVSHLVPCWAVTSLSAKGRIPFQAGLFDIVIFDEASQCDIASALPLLYRAKTAVVIGDPKQLSHISSMPKGQDQVLLEKHSLLKDHSQWSYTHQSLFDLAATQVAANGVVNLVDHHRSHADIIGFSNKEFYEGRLRVATGYKQLKRPSHHQAGILWHDIKGHTVRPNSGGALNKKEADAVVWALRDLVIGQHYVGTIGVVTPFRAQANAIIEAINRDNTLATLLAQREFLVDTVHKFQGDERDVIIFSPAVSEGMPSGALSFLRGNGNLFNVAITRARAQLIVIGDLSACSNCDVGYLARFASYTQSLEKSVSKNEPSKTSDLGPRYPDVAQPELVSDWERKFYVAAYRGGFRLIPQYVIEKYVVDFLMVEGDERLAIEIDGELYHRNWTGELCKRDQIRNKRLTELGYDVIRFWVYEVRDDLPGCLARLKSWREKASERDKSEY